MGIIIAGLIAIAVGIWLLASIARLLGDRQRVWLFCIAMALPLSSIVNLAVKKPVLDVIGHRYDVSFSSSTLPPLFVLVGLAVVGISEESMKLLPLLTPRIRRATSSREGRLAVALGIGFGFGVSEASYMTWVIWAHRPDIARLPFYTLTGFSGERVVAMFLHSAMILIPVSQISKGSLRFTSGLFAAMCVHALVDLPVALFQAKRLSYFGVLPFLVVALLICYWVFIRPLRWNLLKDDALQEKETKVFYLREGVEK